MRKSLRKPIRKEIIMNRTYPFEEKTTEQLIKECNEANKNSKTLSPEEELQEEIEDDAQGGYRPETDDDED